MEMIRTAVRRKDHRWIHTNATLLTGRRAAELVDSRCVPSAFGTAGSSFGSWGVVLAGKAVRPVRRTQHRTARVNTADRWQAGPHRHAGARLRLTVGWRLAAW
jgi:hypothetical protein